MGRLTKAQRMHRRAQKAEGAVLAALYSLDLAEAHYLPALEGRSGGMMLRQTIQDTKKALNRARAKGGDSGK